ncbi:MAG: ABC transporter permease [Saprospiraceae bacterium]|nr:ABC transporter permease [Saprospiraceae bacterium]HMS67845.1 ABC transporter permease [Saprospiraceae bacterium]
MDKIWIIIKREYLSRVMKKSFLLVTILAPLSIAVIAVVGGYFASSSSGTTNVAIVDEATVLKNYALPDGNIKYTILDGNVADLKLNYIDKGFGVLVQIPKMDSLGQAKLPLKYFSKDKLSISNISKIENDIKNGLEAYKLANSGIDPGSIERLKIRVNMENALSSDAPSGDNGAVKGNTSSKLSSIIATALAYAMGFMMYMVIFIFGGMVMRSVMEEKISRIVEVMISSVKPFQLLLGKVIGVGLVGLTQLLIWMILIPAVMFLVAQIYAPDSASMVSGPQAQQAKELYDQINTESGSQIMNVIKEIKSFNWWVILPAFAMFFFGGYFLYSSLFAAIGASIGDDLAEGQQMMLPIIVPVILAFIMIPSVLQDPNGPVAVFGSLFPLFSPIIMPARLPFDPPVWQVLVSLVFLFASVVAFTWVAARIYRVGIFMYGKKVSFKELGKWIFYKS